VDLLIRGLPDEVHAELIARAAARDQSLRAYLVDVLSQHVSTLSVDEWLARVAALPAARPSGRSGADWVAEVRGDAGEEQKGRRRRAGG
jgi:plasmid stability protein